MKSIAATLIYLVAFAAHLVPIQVLRQPKPYADWRDLLHAFGGAPFAGTEMLVSTLRFWWLISLAALWWVYWYGPIVGMGRIV